MPDEKLLPGESIRFFKIDPLWITHLLDGALSIGRTDNNYHSMDSTNWNALLNEVYPLRQTPVQGFLLRSSVVTSRFHFQVKAYNVVLADTDSGGANRNGNLLTQTRLERLNDDTMLGLFYYNNKDVANNTIAPVDTNNRNNLALHTLDFYLKPEVLHFGLHVTGGKKLSDLKKQLRDQNGSLNQNKEIATGKLPGNDTYRTVKVNDLAQAIKTTLNQSPFEVSQFAFQMIEGVEKVRFQVRSLI